MNLKNRIAVITGAQSGIGLATAFLFATEGAETILVDIRDAGREIEKIQQKGGSAHFCHADHRSAGQGKRIGACLGHGGKRRRLLLPRRRHDR